MPEPTVPGPGASDRLCHVHRRSLLGGGRAAHRVLAAVALAGAGSLLLAGCGQSAGANATAACRLVQRSVALWARASALPAPQRTTLDDRAEDLLTRAAPLANIAAGTNGGYQPLAATLGEVGRVPESRLVPALRAECANPNAANGPLLPSS